MKKLIFAVSLAVPTFFFSQETSKDKKCDLSADFKEPKPEKSIQSKLKRGDATIEDLRKHIEIENDVDTKGCGFSSIYGAIR